MDYNINFKGNYLIARPPQKLWNKLKKEIICRNGKITELANSGNKLIFVDNSFDDYLHRYLIKKRFDFSYNSAKDSAYDEISTINSLFPVLKKSHRGISSQRKHQLRSIKKACDTNALLYKWQANDYIQKTLKLLNINERECYISTEKNVTNIYRIPKNTPQYLYNIEDMEKIAACSPNNNEGTNFVYIYPKIYGEPTKRIAIDRKGNIKKEYSLDEFKNFYAEFLDSVKIETKRTKSN